MERMRRAVLAGAASALLLGGCARAPSFKDVSLPTLGAETPVSLASCPTARCLTAYVAPWCGYCRASTRMLLALRERLKAKDVFLRVVVGQDSPERVRGYAAEFGPDTLLDPGGQVDTAGGVPHFFVSDSGGRILHRSAGVPGVFEPPFAAELLDSIAGALRVFDSHD